LARRGRSHKERMDDGIVFIRRKTRIRKVENNLCFRGRERLKTCRERELKQRTEREKDGATSGRRDAANSREGEEKRKSKGNQVRDADVCMMNLRTEKKKDGDFHSGRGPTRRKNKSVRKLRNAGGEELKERSFVGGGANSLTGEIQGGSLRGKGPGRVNRAVQ